MGGEHPATVKVRNPRRGSSPRGRGTLQQPGYSANLIRFIPAWAGNTLYGDRLILSETVHPRVGGEHAAVLSATSLSPGSSPRGRGTPVARQKKRTGTRFIPAWAGNTTNCRVAVDLTAVHPRVGGEHTAPSRLIRDRVGSSPRGRGTHSAPRQHVAVRRFIPAWAGNTLGSTLTVPILPVHPRVGGEHARDGQQVVGGDGSSPRGRGTRLNPLHA